MQGDAEDLFNRLLEGIAKGEWSDLAELYAEDAVVVMPFAGVTGLTLKGRQAIANHFARAASAPLTIRPTNVRVHRIEDRKDVIAEFDYELVGRDGAVSAVVPNIQWLRAEKGLISESRDYHHHEAIAAAVQAIG